MIITENALTKWVEDCRETIQICIPPGPYYTKNETSLLHICYSGKVLQTLECLNAVYVHKYTGIGIKLSHPWISKFAENKYYSLLGPSENLDEAQMQFCKGAIQFGFYVPYGFPPKAAYKTFSRLSKIYSDIISYTDMIRAFKRGVQAGKYTAPTNLPHQALVDVVIAIEQKENILRVLENAGPEVKMDIVLWCMDLKPFKSYHQAAYQIGQELRTRGYSRKRVWDKERTRQSTVYVKDME